VAGAGGACRVESKRGPEEGSMPTIEESIEIERPCTEVFEFATDPDNAVLYQSNLMEYGQQGEGPWEKGTRDQGTIRVAGKKLTFSQEVTEWDPPHRTVMRSVEAPMHWEFEMRFEELGPDRTRMTIHQEVKELGGFFGKLGDAIVTKMYTRDVRSNLENLKELMEH
jgi:hypothetical protein